MSTVNPSTQDVARLREAGDWVQLLGAHYDQELIDRWTAWCASDPRNVRAFESIQDVWDAFAGVHPVAPAASRQWRPRAWMSLAAGVLLLVGIGTRLVQHQEFRTSVGEQRSETLVDGSRLELAPDSTVRVRFTPFRREVELQRGQAFFAVSHSPLRDFIVNARGLEVTASGTAFDVRMSSGDTFVTVSEGSVHVAPKSVHLTEPPREVLAEVGQRITFSEASRDLNSSAVDPVAAESWRRGVLPFVGEPLDVVIAEINRYSARKIDIAPGVSRTLFTGTVSLAHMEDWLNALPQIFSVEIIGRGSNDIHIRSRGIHDVG
jgi:transmembrane sensor